MKYIVAIITETGEASTKNCKTKTQAIRYVKRILSTQLTDADSGVERLHGVFSFTKALEIKIYEKERT